MTVIICVNICVCVYCSDVSYTNFVNNEENKGVNKSSIT